MKFIEYHCTTSFLARIVDKSWVMVSPFFQAAVGTGFPIFGGLKATALALRARVDRSRQASSEVFQQLERGCGCFSRNHARLKS
jgi:hypothetical protein